MAKKNLYKSLLREAGGENMGGFRNRVLFYPDHMMKTTPVLIEDPQSTEELALAEGAYEFIDPVNKPIAMYATDKTVGMKAENQGELDGQSFKQTGELFHPGMATELAAIARLLNNCPGSLVLRTPEGEQIMVGQPGLPVYLKPSFDGGTGRADRRGMSFTFEADSYVPFMKLKTPIADFDDHFVIE